MGGGGQRGGGVRDRISLNAKKELIFGFLSSAKMGSPNRKKKLILPWDAVFFPHYLSPPPPFRVPCPPFPPKRSANIVYPCIGAKPSVVCRHCLPQVDTAWPL